ncbi:MGH1-like glycoside hydrolase domain-containing protein [Marinoscillum sp.]|uniref:MGH1-like glycoside hydrolase domain-containing protein n=1 Tax=Marinoscillum sp. TaxID=2024838 RepID=UPI003BA8EBDD
MTQEEKRLEACREGTPWKEWGPYLSERQWATVREDYTESGNAWESIVHDQARSKSYRWGEDGIGGFSNSDQRICFSWAFWNGKDSILKERLFGLTGHEGNHGEDVKEQYYYLDSTPTHSYMKMLYKYPINEFPYSDLVVKNQKLSKKDKEYELLDTGVFDKDEYFDIFLEYAKSSFDDFLLKAVIHNRSDKEAEITILPTFWYRNTWSSGRDKRIPEIKEFSSDRMLIKHHHIGDFHVYLDQSGLQEQAYCDNATNRVRLYGVANKQSDFPKDAINDYVVNGKATVNPDKVGTKASAIYKLKIPAGESRSVKVRMSQLEMENPFEQYDEIFAKRIAEADSFYRNIHGKVVDKDLKNIQRQAFAGMMWSKQFYYYNVRNWLFGDPGRMKPSATRRKGRNSDWQHLYNYDILSMPDKWEYPWYAAWDLAFHCIPIARIDADFAKNQLLLLLKERYMHPNGQIPAYEWNFTDVNPPVHAWAVLRVFQIDRKATGKADLDFLQKAFHKLLLNFTWWVNRKDANGNNVFEGGFLGLDNIGVFDRNHQIVEDARLEQADSTSWMAMFSLNMLRIALDLSMESPVYQDMAIKFFEHFLYISGAMNSIGDTDVDLWDDEENFYYDVMHTPSSPNQRMKVRSMVGLIPLFAIEILRAEVYNKLPEFRERLDFFLKERPKLASLVSRWEEPGQGERRLLSILRGFRMKKILERMLDEDEFLSKYGIRALSKYHEKHPYKMEIAGEKFEVAYLPGESDSSFFGGNSNWRGPIWFPVNYLILESLLKFSYYYGEDYKVEFPIGSGEEHTLLDVTREICDRLISIFRKDKDGNRPVYGDSKKLQTDPHFRDYILFYEYFHGDSGLGLGASHQTGWTGLVAELIHRYYN